MKKKAKVSIPLESVQSLMEKRSSKELSRLVESYQTVFNTEAGKEVLADLIKVSGIFTANPDQSLLQFNEGQRNMVLYILATIQVDLSALIEAERQSEE